MNISYGRRYTQPYRPGCTYGATNFNDSFYTCILYHQMLYESIGLYAWAIKMKEVNSITIISGMLNIWDYKNLYEKTSRIASNKWQLHRPSHTHSEEVRPFWLAHESWSEWDESLRLSKSAAEEFLLEDAELELPSSRSMSARVVTESERPILSTRRIKLLHYSSARSSANIRLSSIERREIRSRNRTAGRIERDNFPIAQRRCSAVFVISAHPRNWLPLIKLDMCAN